jgi:N-acetyl-alpha-D-muramate 1-phosphate uridylyltransferase
VTAITKGMALAAGLGTRMRPLTDDRPKALVEVGGKALVDWALERYAAVGVERCVVNVHHFADLMDAHLSGHDGPPQITVSDERGAVLETGGGVVKALPELGDTPFFVSNVDAVWVDEGEPELARMMKAWDPVSMDALLLLAPMDRTLGFDGAGDAFLDEDGGLRFRGDAASAPYAYAGVQILHPRVLAGRKAERFSMMEVWRELVPRRRIFGLAMKAFWMHVGDPKARDEAEARLAG